MYFPEIYGFNTLQEFCEKSLNWINAKTIVNKTDTVVFNAE